MTRRKNRENRQGRRGCGQEAVLDGERITHEDALKVLLAELDTCERTEIFDRVPSEVVVARWVAYTEQLGAERRPQVGQPVRVDSLPDDRSQFRICYLRRGPYNGPYSAVFQRGEGEWSGVDAARWESLCRLILRGGEQ